MSKPVVTILCCFVMLFTVMSLCRQIAHAESSLERALRTFTASDVQGYVQPLQDVFAANMTSGWYRTASVPSSGFNISFNIIAMGALINDDLKTYTANAPPGYTPATFKTATILGKQGGLVTDANTGLSYAATDGVLNVPLLPLATLQATIGHIQGTEVIIRGIPLPEVSGFPKVTFWGIGGRHSISQYLWDQAPPMHIAFGAFYNTILIGDFIDIKSFLIGPQVSKSFSILELYGGFGYTKNTIHLKFTSTRSGNPAVDVELEGTDKVRATVGAALNLGFLHLHGDLNLGLVTSISTSIGFGF